MKPYITVYLPPEIHSRVQEVVNFYRAESISSLVESMFRNYLAAMPTPTSAIQYPPTGKQE